MDLHMKLLRETVDDVTSYVQIAKTSKYRAARQLADKASYLLHRSIRQNMPSLPAAMQVSAPDAPVGNLALNPADAQPSVSLKLRISLPETYCTPCPHFIQFPIRHGPPTLCPGQSSQLCVPVTKK